MLQPTTAHPEGMTTMPERWTLGDSQNHVILLQIEEWFHTGVAGIKQAPSSVAYRDLIYQADPGRRPHPRQGPLHHAAGHGPQRVARATRPASRASTSRCPRTPRRPSTCRPTSAAQTFVATGSGDARYLRYEDGYQVYDVAPGDVTFLQGTSAGGTVGGTVPATLSLTLGAPASFGAFTPGRRAGLHRERRPPT